MHIVPKSMSSWKKRKSSFILSLFTTVMSFFPKRHICFDLSVFKWQIMTKSWSSNVIDRLCHNLRKGYSLQSWWWLLPEKKVMEQLAEISMTSSISVTLENTTSGSIWSSSTVSECLMSINHIESLLKLLLVTTSRIKNMYLLLQLVQWIWSCRWFQPVQMIWSCWWCSNDMTLLVISRTVLQLLVVSLEGKYAGYGAAGNRWWIGNRSTAAPYHLYW